MELATIEMEPEVAAEKLEAYRNADPQTLTPDDLSVIAAYKALAKGAEVIDLIVAMRDAGLDAQGLPKLAIARADQSTVAFDPTTEWTNSMMITDGGGKFSPRWGTTRGNGKATEIVIPPRTWPPVQLGGIGNPRRHIAYLPTIPPDVRPAAPRHYYLLWEAVWKPAPPVDPFLLRHITGSLYVVLAQWDLTEVEQAVLRGRIQANAT